MTQCSRTARHGPKPTKPTKPGFDPACLPWGKVLSVKSVLSQQLQPDQDAFEERAAILEFDAGMARDAAENTAARAQGFVDAQAFFTALFGSARQP